jgi:hypothetical protein
MNHMPARKETNKDIIVLKILKQIISNNEEDNYPTNLSRSINMDRAYIHKKLTELSKKKYLNKPRKIQISNKTIFSVNINKIIEEFFNYLKSKNSKLNIKKSYYTNPYLIKFFKELIKVSEINTLEELFEKIRNTSPYDGFITEEVKNTTLFNEFIEILLLIEESNMDHIFIDKIIKILSGFSNKN